MREETRKPQAHAMVLSRSLDPSARLELASRLSESRICPTLDQIRSGDSGVYLGLGDAGREAQLLKQYLELLGFPSSAGDVIDAPTGAAICSFQAAKDLSATGLVDADTLQKLEALVAALMMASLSGVGQETLEPGISPLAALDATTPTVLPSQAEALRAIGEASPVVAPTTRGPEAGGLYINPATGRPTAAGLPPELLSAFADMRSSPGVTVPDGAADSVMSGSDGHPLLPAGALAALRAGGTKGPITSPPPKVPLVNAKGEALRRTGPMAKLREALPTGKKPPVLGPNGEPLRAPKNIKAPVTLVDGQHRPLSRPTALTRLREALPGGSNPGPQLLATNGKPLDPRQQHPSEPTPALLNHHDKPLAPVPNAGQKTVLLDQNEHPLITTGKPPAEPLQLVQRNGQPLSARKGKSPTVAAPPPAGSPEQRTAQTTRVIEDPKVVGKMDQLYLDSANSALKDAGSTVRLKPGETLRDHFNAGHINGTQLTAAEERFTLANNAQIASTTPTDRFNAGKINGKELANERLAWQARERAMRGVGADPTPVPVETGRGWGKGVASKVAGVADGTVSIAEGALKANMSPAAANALHIGGKGLFVVGAAMDALTLGGSVKEDLDRGDGHLRKTVQTGAEIAGGWLGAAAAGAGAGCLAGTVFPGLGNCAGAVIGFVAGAGGYFLGHDVVGHAVGEQLSKLA